jgi:hypothetical protein
LNGFNDPEATGKIWVAMFYNYVDYVVPYQVFTALIFICYLVIVARHSRGLMPLVFQFVLIAPLAPYFGYITKEALILFFCVISYVVSNYNRRLALPLFWCFLLLFSYYARQYYLPIIFISFYVCFMSKRKSGLVLSLLPIVLLVPFYGEGIFEQVYRAKEIMWVRLAYYSEVNTLFPLNFDYGFSVVAFFKLWGFNLFYLLTGVVRHFGLVGLASFVSLFTVSVSLFYWWRKSDFRIWLFSFSAVIFMTFLVPDSGTFVRHSTLLACVAFFGVILNKGYVEKKLVF